VPRLQKGERVPDFVVTTVDGRGFSYASIWQHRNLVLITLPDVDSEEARACSAAIGGRLAEFGNQNTACIVTADRVPGLDGPGALVADKWGEIVYVASAPHIDALPPVDDLLEWIEYLQLRCPECEGETR